MPRVCQDCGALYKAIEPKCPYCKSKDFLFICSGKLSKQKYWEWKNSKRKVKLD
jgi:RNA polymerase subunit RPABC4/transcription elongation factor Spt4